MIIPTLFLTLFRISFKQNMVYVLYTSHTVRTSYLGLDATAEVLERKRC